MGTRTVRLDESAEASLTKLCKTTGLSISEVLKRGLKAYEHAPAQDGSPTPWDVYQRVDLGEGGWSVAPARDTKHALQSVLRRKYKR